MSLDPNTDRPDSGPDDLENTAHAPEPEHDPAAELDLPEDPAQPVPPPLDLSPPGESAQAWQPPFVTPTPLDRPMEPPRRRKTGSGGWLPVAGIGMIVLALVVLALFLPPISLWDEIDRALNDDEDTGSDTLSAGGFEFVRLSADAPRLESGGLVIEVDPAALAGDYGVAVASALPADYLAGQTPGTGWYCGVDLPPRHALASPVYSLVQNGTPPVSLTVQVAALPETVTDPDMLALYSWNANTERWDFLSTQPGAELDTLAAQLDYLPRCVAVFRSTESTRQVGVTLDLNDTFTPDALAANARVLPAGLRPIDSGALQGVLAPGFETGQSYAVMPVIQNFEDAAVIDVATVQHILENPAVRDQHAQQVAAFVLAGSDGDNGAYSGVMLDYREVPPDLGEDYAALVRGLAGLLHKQDRLLAVTIPAPAFDETAGTWDTGGYDWGALGRAADELVILMPLDPAFYAPEGSAARLLDWAVTQVDRSHLLLSFSALSVEVQDDGMPVPVTLADALGYVGVVAIDPPETVEAGQTVVARIVPPDGVQVNWIEDEQTGAPALRYTNADGTTLSTMWITDAQALYERLQWAAQYQLSGVIVRDMMAPGAAPGLAAALVAYRVDEPPESGELSLSVDWTVREGETVLLQMTNPLDKPLTFQSETGHTALTFEAAVHGADLGGATVAVAAVPTPTPAPTEVPAAATSEAPPTEPAPIEGEPAPAEVAALPDIPLPTVDPAILASASIGTAFEPGGAIITMNGRSIRAIGQTHLDWMQVEVPFQVGAAPEDQQHFIDDAQANGFKILLTVTGEPGELAAADREQYLTAYASYVGRLAMLGADGIEIWHDMNRAESWPAGQINPQAYVQMLALAYHAIKTSNPSTLVISGGLTPTLAAGDAGRSETAWNHDAYYAGMADAGAGQYTDCIGAYYVDGTVPPDTTSGDPRGDAAHYYLPTFTGQVWNTFGGILPVCYTRFGILSAEGYGSLPAGYEWAQDNTVAEQAEWLSSAVSGYLDGTQVRLLIVWNMDATTLDESGAAGGYAIIRPGDTCPACESLAPVLE
jgi:hypothetical protein